MYNGEYSDRSLIVEIKRTFSNVNMPGYDHINKRRTFRFQTRVQRRCEVISLANNNVEIEITYYRVTLQWFGSVRTKTEISPQGIS